MAAPTRPDIALVNQAPMGRAAAYRVEHKHIWCQHQGMRVLRIRLWSRLDPVALEILYTSVYYFQPMVVQQIENAARINYAVAAPVPVPGPTLGQYPRLYTMGPPDPLVSTALGECPRPSLQEVIIPLVPSLGVESQRRRPLQQWSLQRFIRLPHHRLGHQSLWDNHTCSCQPG
jgi:hypothetical protein